VIDRETLIEYLESHIKLVIGLTAGLIILLALVLAVGLSSGSPDAGRRSSMPAGSQTPGKKEAKSGGVAIQPIPPETLWIPSEPLAVPGVLLSREPRAQWSAEDAKEWYTVPDDALLSDLAAVSARKIDEILESVP
jgi:hypothetical protein